MVRIGLWALAGGLLILTLAPCLGRFTQPFEIFSHFRVQYLILSFVLVMATTIARQWRTLILCSLCLTINIWAVTVRAGVTVTTALPEAGAVRVVWANLYRRQQTLTALAELALKEKADMIAVTELPPKGANAFRQALPDFQCFVIPTDTDNPFAVAIAIKAPCAALPENQKLDMQAVDQVGLRLVALHARPPWDNRRTAERDATILSGFSAAHSRQSVIVGDFNATPWSPVFSSGLMRQMTRVACGGPLQPTWRSSNLITGLVIDQVYISKGLKITGCRVGPDIGSDHRPLLLAVVPAR